TRYPRAVPLQADPPMHGAVLFDPQTARQAGHRALSESHRALRANRASDYDTEGSLRSQGEPAVSAVPRGEGGLGGPGGLGRGVRTCLFVWFRVELMATEDMTAPEQPVAAAGKVVRMAKPR